jgi:hypothetical protein
MTYTEKDLEKAREIIALLPEEKKNQMLLELLVNNDAIGELLERLKEYEAY